MAAAPPHAGTDPAAADSDPLCPQPAEAVEASPQAGAAGNASPPSRPETPPPEPEPPAASDATLDASPPGADRQGGEKASDAAEERDPPPPAAERGPDGWPTDPAVLSRLLRAKRDELRRKPILPPASSETQLSPASAHMELLRLSRGADADLAAEHARYRLRAEAAGIARREVEGRRKKLEMLRRRFGGVVKANASRAEHALRRAEQEKGEAQAKEREIERLKEAAEELAKFKEEREKLARGNERFLAFLEAVAEGQPEMPSFEAILGRFSSLSSDSDALAARLSDARAASQETAGALEALAAESLARQEGADAATLRREVAVVSFEAEKAQNEVDGILERDGARMEKSEAVRRAISELHALVAAHALLEPADDRPPGTARARNAVALSQLDDVLRRVRAADELLEACRKVQARSRPATAARAKTPRAESPVQKRKP